MSNYSLSWDAKAIIKAAGGPTALRRLLRKHGIEPPRLANTVFQWSSRGEIPARWIPNVIYVILAERLAPFNELLVQTDHVDEGYRQREDAA